MRWIWRLAGVVLVLGMAGAAAYWYFGKDLLLEKLGHLIPAGSGSISSPLPQSSGNKRVRLSPDMDRKPSSAGQAAVSVGGSSLADRSKEDGKGAAVGVQELFAGLLKERDPGQVTEERIRRFQAGVAALKDETILQALWKQFLGARMGEGPLSYRLRDIILERWAQLNGQEAVKALVSLPGKDDIYTQDSFSKVMNAWASVNPLGALEWYHAPEQDKLALERGLRPSSQFYQKVFGEYFAKDRQGALASINALNRFNDAQAAVRGMVERAANPDDWIAIAKGLESADELEGREALLVEAYSALNLPLEAARWAETVPDQAARIEIAKKVARQWGRQEPFQAADWLYGQVKNQPDALQMVDTLLSAHSPVAMREWAAKNRIKN